jgi:hypothetical protein
MMDENPFAKYVTQSSQPDTGENPFAKYVRGSGAKPAQTSTRGNFFNQSDEPQQPQRSGVAMNALAGLNEGIYGTLGAPVDAVTWALNQGIRGANAVTGADLPQIKEPFGGSRSISKAFGTLGVPEPETVEATTTGEKIARGLGQGAGYTIAPEAALAGLGRAGLANVAPKATEAAGQLLGKAASPGAVATNAAIGGAAGAGSTAAMEAVPDPWKPYAGLAGGLGAGGLAAAGSMVPQGVREAGRVVGDYLAPLSAKGQERTAARIMRDAASNPTEVRETLANLPDDLVPGSKPTTFQVTGDMGLGGLERQAATRAPAEFNQRRAEQNAARVGALEGIQPGGAPEAVSQAVRGRLAQIDQETTAAIDAARKQALAGADRAVGGLPAIEQRAGAAADAARQRATGAADAIGGRGQPEEYGSTIRAAIRSAEDAARAKERALWDAVDPGWTLALEAGNVRTMAQDIARSIPDTAKPMSGEEADIFGAAARLNGVVSFRRVDALRSRISTEMRRELVENGQSPTYARLSRLRGAIEDDLQGVINRRVAEEADAVARGEMRAEDTIVARVGGWRDAWYERQAEAGAINSAGVGGNAGERSAAVLGSRGTAGEAGRRAGYSPGDQGLPRDDGLVPNFDQAARERLTAATDSTRERAQTFNRGTPAAITRREGQTGPYRIGDAAVPGKVFVSGPKGGEEVARFRQIVGDGPAMDALSEYAASQLRRYALQPDGTISPSRLETWRRMYADALRAFPALDARLSDADRAARTLTETLDVARETTRLTDSLRKLVRPDGTIDPTWFANWRRNNAGAVRAHPELERQFSDAAAAAETLTAATEAKATRLKEYQAGLVGRLVGAEDPADVTRIIGGIFSRQDAVAQMQRLVRETANDPQAREGLRKAVADHIRTRMTGNTEGGTSGQALLKSDQFQTFVKQNRAALATVFKPEEVSAIQAIAADLQRANRSLAAVRIPGQSNTAQDLTAIAKSKETSLLGKIILAAGAAAGAGADGMTGGLVGLLGARTLAGMREAGLQRVDDIVKDAMLNPDRARILLSKVPVEPDQGQVLALAQRYRRAATASAAVTMAQPNERQREPLRITVGPQAWD